MQSIALPALRLAATRRTPRLALAPTGTPIAQIDRRLRITFTCTASLPSPTPGADPTPCGHRSSHEFSKRSYDKGVVIVQCPGCNNRHLIADHLHWFHSTPSPAHPTGLPFDPSRPKRARTVEDLLREKGEQVQWGAPAGEGGQLRWRVSERTEDDGGTTVEVKPVDEGDADTGVTLGRQD
ncbi:uncharacterized protein RHOBADRAFT_44671 [Rhodotorula graminis WP1]|uniref:DNL-type domain-containing protein n=1 Tax=Rhodotorula graminis (strain WP1) TaxID=578459 RepID=A0A194S0Q4_RHOGW|nr:uncharacterized protein RHOBADRAFT_44671 [Rhodotorula graminis WP1]KPV74187.1 hypothetical protein RHOBADRAFT_44671 [Rhodotorula graminis WP1]